nr:malonic semialdehyde reductase [Bordetella sp. 15P40C-2]
MMVKEATDDLREPLDAAALDTLFRDARSIREWQDRTVPMDLLRTLYGLMRMGPTAANCQPARVAFVTSAEAKARLLPLMDEGNVAPTRQAPVTAIVAYDLRFYEQMAKVFPHQPGAASWFNHTPEAAREAALRNGSLQGGYFIMAARALGLDCGPMGGFDAHAVAETFFPGQPVEVNFVCNLGYGCPAPFPRLPRLDFEEACVVY